MTIIRDYKTTFTAGPIPAKYLEHSTGLPGVNNRWLASSQGLADGTVITALKPSVGSLTLSSAGTAPTVNTDEYGNKFIRFGGADDIFVASGLTGIGTVAVVARVRGSAPASTDQGIFHTGGAYMNRTTTNTTKALVTGAASKFPAVDPTGPKYHVFSLAASGSASRYAIDTVAAEIGASTGTHTEITLGRASTAIFGQLDIYEVVTTAGALSLGQLSDGYTAMKAKYGTALA